MWNELSKGRYRKQLFFFSYILFLFSLTWYKSLGFEFFFPCPWFFSFLPSFCFLFFIFFIISIFHIRIALFWLIWVERWFFFWRLNDVGGCINTMVRIAVFITITIIPIGVWWYNSRTMSLAAVLLLPDKNRLLRV
jgi:hypothetical protein